jgi:hypothetical protein
MMVDLPKEKSQPATDLTDYLMMIYGPPGVGKSTFVNAMYPDCLFVSTDRGTRFLERYSVEVYNWEDVGSLIAKLKKNKSLVNRYGAFAVDHIQDAFQYCEDWVCDELGVDTPGDAAWGAGWNMLKKQFGGFLKDLLSFGKPVIFVAHEDIRTIKTRTSEFDRIMPSMTKTARKLLWPLVDICGYAGYSYVRVGRKEKEERRTIRFQPREDVEAKDRPGRCPLEPISLDGRKFLQLFNEGRRTTNGKKKSTEETKEDHRQKAKGKRKVTKRRSR